jgi:TBC1 domain family protein 5
MSSFPDIPFFRERQVQESLTNVLFIYSVMHRDTGYRQGEPFLGFHCCKK